MALSAATLSVGDTRSMVLVEDLKRTHAGHAGPHARACPDPHRAGPVDADSGTHA